MPRTSSTCSLLVMLLATALIAACQLQDIPVSATGAPTSVPPSPAQPTTTPLPTTNPQLISASNADRLEEVAILGRGKTWDLDWSPDGTLLALKGSVGVWLYDPADPDPVPRLLDSGWQSLRVAFSPDGRWLADGDTVWDVQSGERVQLTPPIPVEAMTANMVHTLAAWGVLPGGRTAAASIYNAEMVQVWDAETRQEIALLTDQDQQRITTAAFSPDGVLLAFSGWSMIRVWETASGEFRCYPDAPLPPTPTPNFDELMNDLTPTPGPRPCGLPPPTNDSFTEALALSPDHALLASGTLSGQVLVWDAETGVQRYTLDVPHPHNTVYAQLNAVAFSPDGRLLAGGNGEGYAAVWEAATGQEIATIPGEFSQVYGLEFSPDGSTLAIAHDDGTIRFWDVRARAMRVAWTDHSDDVLELAFSADGTKLTTTSYDCVVRWWLVPAVEPGQLAVNSEVSWNDAWGQEAVSLSGTGRAACANMHDRVFVWDSTSSQELPGGAWSEVTAIALSPDGRRMVVGSVGSMAADVWDLEQGRGVARYDIPPLAAPQYRSFPRFIAFSPDGSLLGIVNDYRDLYVWSLGADEPLLAVNVLDPGPRDDGIVALAFSPDNRLVAASGSDAVIRVYAVADGGLLHALRVGSGRLAAAGIAFSADGSLLAANIATFGMERDGSLQVWEMQSGEMLSEYEARGLPWGRGIAFDPDGTLLAIGGMDGTVRLWHVKP